MHRSSTILFLMFFYTLQLIRLEIAMTVMDLLGIVTENF